MPGIRVLRTCLRALILTLFSASLGYASSARLAGAVRTSDGRLLEGVAVSARSDAKTFTTSVFTDVDGKYDFPPLESGLYRVWAQAVGFEIAGAEVRLGGSRKIRQNFQLKTTEDFSKQLSAPEWMASLPEDTAENRRMKFIFRNNCGGCHMPNFVLRYRFDEAGWRTMIDLMQRLGIRGEASAPASAEAPLLLVAAFRDELAAYLARMRGPGPSPVKLRRFPRPRGEAAQVVITEYDVTSSSNPNEFVTHDGSNWAEGVPSAYEARGPHDLEIDPDGFAWFTYVQTNPLRTIGRLDPKTGEVKNYKLEGKRGMAVESHGIIIDQRGIAWFNAGNALGKIDTRTEKIERFDPPKGMARVGGTLDVGPDGTIWAQSRDGALAFDSGTSRFTEFKSVSPGYAGRPFGVGVDEEGNGWWTQTNYDKVGKGILRTGETSEVALEPFAEGEKTVTESDGAIYKKAGSDWNSAASWQQGPRRLHGDRKGNMWIAMWWGNSLAKIDIRTNQVTCYPYPTPGFFGVYGTVVDRNGMVWVNLMVSDRVARFNPETQEWTEFLLPSRGTETRYIAVDNRKDPVEIWTAYWRTNRIARLQFRAQEALRARAPR